MFQEKMVRKSSQSRESDFLKMSVSPRRRAHFQRLGQARPGQKGLAKPGQAREGLLGPTGGQTRNAARGSGLGRGLTRPLRMGPPRPLGSDGRSFLQMGVSPFGAATRAYSYEESPLLAPWVPLGPLGDPLGTPWGSLGEPLGPLGTPWDLLGDPLGSLGGPPGAASLYSVSVR